MRKNIGFTVLSTLTTAYLLLTVWRAHWESIFDLFTGMALAIAGALLFVAVARVAKHTSLPFWERLFPLGYWLALAVSVGVYDAWQSRINRLPNFLSIVGNNDSHFSRFEFKENGCYKYADGFMGPDYFSYGTYLRRDSLLFLTPQSERNKPLSLTLLIRPYAAAKQTTFDSTSSLHNIYKDDSASYQADFHITELNYH